jgi:hypothetical protein
MTRTVLTFLGATGIASSLTAASGQVVVPQGKKKAVGTTLD